MGRGVERKASLSCVCKGEDAWRTWGGVGVENAWNGWIFGMVFGCVMCFSIKLFKRIGHEIRDEIMKRDGTKKGRKIERSRGGIIIS